jgi:hypothetical protein
MTNTTTNTLPVLNVLGVCANQPDKPPLALLVLRELPLSLIPTFAVPFSIILHIVSLIKVRKLVVAAEESAA